MPTINCPKCGFQQEGGEECLRCGVIFARYYAAISRASSSPQPQEIQRPRQRSLFRFLYRVFSWVSLAALLIVLFLILRPSSPPRIVVPPDASDRAQAKVEKFRNSLEKGREPTLELDEPELNGWLGANLALKRPADGIAAPPKAPQETVASLAKKAMAVHQLQSPAVEEVQSSVRDVKIELREDSLRAYVSFELYGKELSLEMEGRLTVQDGCLRLEPTAGRLGSLPLLAGTLDAAARRLFDSPENKEKFRLPPEIQDVAVRQGRLVITSR